MNSRDRVKCTLENETPDRVPRDLWCLPGIYMFRNEDLQYILSRYPTDFAGPVYNYGQSKLTTGTPNVKGKYTDEWGCVWEVKEDGIIGEVKTPRLTSLNELDTLHLPTEILDNADFTQVETGYKQTDKFVLAGTTVRPFERMQFLRGTENLMVDLAYSEKEIYRLRDIVHQFYLNEIQLWCKTPVDGISFMDDWGSQKSLLISPKLWREFYQPLYKEYCDLIHRAGKYAFFHSDGNINEIYPDLIDLGIDAINSQLFCMNIEEIADKYRAKITFWGEIDRQHILPFGTTNEVKDAVRRVRKVLDKGTGGVIAQCEFGLNVPTENIIAVYSAWEE